MSSDTLLALENIIKGSAAAGTDASDVAQILADVGCPSTSIAILENGQISSCCFSTGTDDTQSIFQACSISKAIAGMAIMKLIELDHLSLEDKICDLLPPHTFELMTKDKRTEKLLRLVTIKHLMSHTSGISIGGFPGYPNHSNVPTLDQILEGRDKANTQPVNMHTLPGLAFMYSGGGIEVLQYAVEHVMKMSFQDIMQKHVLRPLNMDRSFYDLPQTENNIATAHYQGYYPAPAEWHVLPELAAAGLWTTPTDLLKAVCAIQDSLDGSASESFMKKETAELMLKTVVDEVALTWFVTPTLMSHSGSNNPGYRTFVCGFADLAWNYRDDGSKTEKLTQNEIAKLTKCGIAIMTNAEQGSVVVSKILAAVSYLKGWPELPYTYLGDASPGTPFAASDRVTDSDWKKWISDKWSEGWKLEEDSNGNPTAGIHSEAMMKILPAAVAPKQFSNGRKSLDFVLDGIQIMLRLGWDGEELIVELHNIGNGKISTLRKGT